MTLDAERAAPGPTEELSQNREESEQPTLQAIRTDVAATARATVKPFESRASTTYPDRYTQLFYEYPNPTPALAAADFDTLNRYLTQAIDDGDDGEYAAGFIRTALKKIKPPQPAPTPPEKLDAADFCEHYFDFCKSKPNFEQVLRAARDVEVVMRYLAQARQGRDVDSEAIFRAILRAIDPQYLTLAHHANSGSKLLRCYKKVPFRLERLSTSVLITFSMQAQNVHDFAAVVVIQKILITRTPERSVAHSVLGEALAKLEKLDEAIATYECAVQLSSCQNKDDIVDKIRILRARIGTNPPQKVSTIGASVQPPTQPVGVDPLRLTFESAIKVDRFDEFLQSLVTALEDWPTTDNVSCPSAKTIPNGDFIGIVEYMARIAIVLGQTIERNKYDFWDPFKRLQRHIFKDILTPETVRKLIDALPPGIRWENIR